MPGNPIDSLILDYMGPPYYLSYEEAVNLVKSFYDIELDKPLWMQYIDYLTNILRGDFGISYIYFSPVIKIISYGLPWTVFLLSISLPLSFFPGVLIGMAIAYKRGSKLDNSISMLSIILRAIPNYIVAILLLYFLGIVLGIFPSGGSHDVRTTPGFTLEYILDVLYHSILPITSYIIVTIGGWIISMRSSTISVLGEDYVRVAEARGLPERRIIFTYVGRNAILPLFTTLAISIGYVFGGSVFIESIFTYPGIGYFLSSAVTSKDYPVIQGCFLIITISVVLANLFADILYSRLDPRIKMG